MATWTAERWKRLSPLLDQALDLLPAERIAFIANLSAAEPQLAEELAGLIRDYDSAAQSDFMQNGPTYSSAAPTLAGLSIGAYVLTEPLGHGGMGSVWLARRNDGRYEGYAAIKLLNLSLVGRSSAERFRREGTILASLRHPNIAQLIDAGVATSGQPYLVLEYVAGLAIDTYCDVHRLRIHERIALFLKVLDGVAHAHTHLVVHRDLKPSNVMVDVDGNVKLLDFGIAKLMHPELDTDATPDTALTRVGANPLTPDFAAPEQIEGKPVTTATDVYALGVMLFLLLSGKHPTAQENVSPAVALRAVLEGEPRRLSEAVTQGGDTTLDNAAALAERRTTTPRKLIGLVSGDLDNIVAKALKKSPTERYLSVGAFADDLRRHLAFEPVAAKPDSTWYRATRFVRRNRSAVAAAALVSAAICAGLVSTLHQANLAKKEAQRANTVREFVESIFEPFSQGVVESKQPTLKSLLEKSVANLRSNTELGVDERIDLLTIFARLSNKVESRAEAFNLIDEAYNLAESQLGAGHLTTALTLAARGQIQLTRQNREAAERDLLAAEPRFNSNGVRGEQLIRLYTSLSALASQRGSAQDSLRYAELGLKERLAFYPSDSPRVATGYSNHGYGLESVGDYKGAADAYEKARATFLKTYDANSYETAISLSQLGNARTLSGRVSAGFKDLLQAQEALALHPARNQRQQANLSRMCSVQIVADPMKTAPAACQLARTFTSFTRPAGDEDDALLSRLEAGAALERGELATARRLLDYAAPILATRGVASWNGSVTATYGELALMEGQPAQAAEIFAKSLVQLGDGFPPHLRRKVLALKALACSQISQSPNCSATEAALAASELDSQSYRDSVYLLPAHTALARLDLQSGKPEAATLRLQRAIRGADGEIDVTSPRWLDAKLWLAASLRASGQCEAASSAEAEVARTVTDSGMTEHPLLRASRRAADSLGRDRCR